MKGSKLELKVKRRMYIYIFLYVKGNLVISIYYTQNVLTYFYDCLFNFGKFLGYFNLIPHKEKVLIK